MFGRKARVKYVVLERTGDVGEFYDVVDVAGYSEGMVMRYKNGAGLVAMVLVGKKYRFLDVGGRYFVGKQLGNDSACEICVDGITMKVPVAVGVVGPPTDPNCPGEDLCALGQSDFATRGIKTLYGTTSIPWKWIIIVALVIGVILFIYKFHGRLGF
jgi:hypothetical protein